MNDFTKEYNELYEKIKKEAKANIKPKRCLICNNEISSCEKSHTIPQSILKELDMDGEYFDTKNI